MLNNRQIHLLHAELFKELKEVGFEVGPGDLGENITTEGINLLALPLRSRLHIGRTAIVELTGLRTPCGCIDRFQKGLKRVMILKNSDGKTFRVGILGIVVSSGDVVPGDPITAELPAFPREPLPAI